MQSAWRNWLCRAAEKTSSVPSLPTPFPGEDGERQGRTTLGRRNNTLNCNFWLRTWTDCKIAIWRPEVIYQNIKALSPLQKAVFKISHVISWGCVASFQFLHGVRWAQSPARWWSRGQLRLRRKIQLFWLWDKGILGIQNRWSIIGILIKHVLRFGGGGWGSTGSQACCGNGSKVFVLTAIFCCLELSSSNCFVTFSRQALEGGSKDPKFLGWAGY